MTDIPVMREVAALERDEKKRKMLINLMKGCSSLAIISR